MKYNFVIPFEIKSVLSREARAMLTSVSKNIAFVRVFFSCVIWFLNEVWYFRRKWYRIRQLCMNRAQKLSQTKTRRSMIRRIVWRKFSLIDQTMNFWQIRNISWTASRRNTKKNPILQVVSIAYRDYILQLCCTKTQQNQNTTTIQSNFNCNNNIINNSRRVIAIVAAIWNCTTTRGKCLVADNFSLWNLRISRFVAIVGSNCRCFNAFMEIFELFAIFWGASFPLEHYANL